jgi:hypothetical protein
VRWAGACLGVLLAGAALAEPVLVDGVAAVVGRRVITRTEVETEGRMVLVNRAGQKGLQQPIDDAFRKSVLDYLLVQELLVQEARRVHGLAVPEVEVDKGVAAFRQRFHADKDFRDFLAESGADEEAVRTIVRRDLTVQALLARVLDVKAPTGPEVSAWLVANPTSLEGASDEARVRGAGEQIVQARREERFAAFVEELKQRTELRVVAEWSAAAG